MEKMVGVPINAQDSSGKAPQDYVWDPDALTLANAVQAGISRLLTAATEQVGVVATTPVFMGVTIDSASEVKTRWSMSNDPPKKYSLVL